MTCEARDPPVDLTGPDLEAASCGSSKRSHRPADDIWDHFKIEQQKNDYLISDSRTSTDLDFDHPALTQVTAPPPIARVQLGDNTEQYDLDNLVSKD